MKGDLKISDNSEEAVLTEPEEHFLTGDIGLILGHPESWITNTAKNIIETLRREELIIFSCVDEFQMNLSNHWGKDFRFVKWKAKLALNYVTSTYICCFGLWLLFINCSSFCTHRKQKLLSFLLLNEFINKQKKMTKVPLIRLNFG